MDALTHSHQQSKETTSRYGGTAEAGGIETVTHLNDLGKGRVDVVVEHRQNEAPILELNARRRNQDQIGAMKMLADIPLVAVERWKQLYGFDLRRANLNDPYQYNRFKRLLEANEQYKCWEGKSKYIMGV